MLVDIGNSRVKWGLAKTGRILAGPAFRSDPLALAAHLDHHWGDLEAPAAVYVSNVAGAAMEAGLSGWVAGHWGVPVRFVKAEVACCGVVNGYERPEKLGVDRWVGLIGLRNHYGLPACLTDCGTALTFDVLDVQGRHLGGLIAPGPRLMKRSLLQETLGVKAVESGVREFLGRNTAAAVESGVFRACAGLVEKAAREATELLGPAPTLVMTGGDGEAVSRYLAIPYQFEADLILRGLLTLAEQGS